MISKILNGDLENISTNSTNSAKVITSSAATHNNSTTVNNTHNNNTNNNNNHNSAINGTKSSLNTEKPNKVSSFYFFFKVSFSLFSF